RSKSSCWCRRKRGCRRRSRSWCWSSLTLASTAGIVDPLDFSRSEGAIENLHFVNQSCEIFVFQRLCRKHPVANVNVSTGGEIEVAMCGAGSLSATGETGDGPGVIIIGGGKLVPLMDSICSS